MRDADGTCEPSIMSHTHLYGYAHPYETQTVRGWEGFDGKNRQWYRLGNESGPETAWSFCYLANRDKINAKDH